MSSSHISLEHIGRHISKFSFFFAVSRMGLGGGNSQNIWQVKSGHFLIMIVLIQMVVESSLGFYKSRGELT